MRAEEPKVGNKMINARADTVATKPAFRRAFERRRCWLSRMASTNGARMAFFIHRPDDRPFAFAGLWESIGAAASL